MLQQIPRVLLRNTLEEKTLRRNKCRICMKLQFGQACFRQICNNASNTLRGLLAIAQITALWTFHRAKVPTFWFRAKAPLVAAGVPLPITAPVMDFAVQRQFRGICEPKSPNPSGDGLKFGARLTPAFTPLTSKSAVTLNVGISRPE